MQKDTAVPGGPFFSAHGTCNAQQLFFGPKKSEHQPKNQFFDWFGDLWSLDWNLTTASDSLCMASHELSNSKELYIWQSIWGLKCVLTKRKWLQATYLYQRVSPSRKGMRDSWFICFMIRRRLLPCSNTNRKGMGCRLIYSAIRPEGLFLCLLYIICVSVYFHLNLSISSIWFC